MKLNTLLLGISLLIPTLSFSQNTFPKLTKDSLIVLTPLQLKKTNLIFVEHSQLKQKNSSLQELVNFQDSSIVKYKQIVETQEKQIQIMNTTFEQQCIQISKLNDSFIKQSSKNKLYKKFTIGGICISVAFLTLFLLK